jgi:endonuclease/exonuclease/phosphatase family metal-dependent hydrolase
MTSDASMVRRAIIKFDTQNTIPAGRIVTSATMTIKVKESGATASRHIAAYQMTQSWDETEATWNVKQTNEKWQTAGGALGTKLAQQTVGSAAGTTVAFDVTPLVAQAVAGKLGSSRYTRIALIDVDPPNDESRRVYYTPDDSNVAARPALKVTYGGKSAPAPPPTTPSAPSGSTLRVLEYNVHHNGIGMDGRNDPNRIADWIAKINPDVVSLVEVESRDGYYGGDGPTLYKTLLEQKTGKTWYSWDIQSAGLWTSGGIRNAILSKYPFSSAYRHEFSVGDGRTIGGVTIAVNGRNINFMSTHIDPYSESHRITEIKEMVPYAAGFAEDRIILGDFNATPSASEIVSFTQSYHDAWTEAMKLGTDKTAPDNPKGNTRRGRIDYVFYSRGEQHLTLQSAQVVDTRDANGLMPSDHRPLLAIFTVK